MYRERGSAVPGAVLWTRTADAEAARVLPDGCIDLIWGEDTGLFAAGPDTRAHLSASPPGTRYAGLRFAPGVGPAVLGAPAHELRDRRVPLDALWPGAEARRLTERVAAAADPGAALEAVVLGRPSRDPVPYAPETAAGLAAGARVLDVAAALGVSERQLHRRCLDAFGYGPKTLARILRLQRALRLARHGLPFAELAGRAGYADQAHLARDVRALTGVPLGRLLAR
ncbi:helix-turn-helix domain-containing protein [Streptomyces sp. NPDC002574]|uniref:helix-turn-helix domain-containing protein n=1 Tax=Streptomyces sp. NPDC002574 TaxID=3364652 RepID=UPI00367F1B90